MKNVKLYYIMSELTGEGIAVIIMVVCISIAAIISIIMTSIYCVKKGSYDRMTDESSYLDTLVASTSCTCK